MYPSGSVRRPAADDLGALAAMSGKPGLAASANGGGDRSNNKMTNATKDARTKTNKGRNIAAEYKRQQKRAAKRADRIRLGKPVRGWKKEIKGQLSRAAKRGAETTPRKSKGRPLPQIKVTDLSRTPLADTTDWRDVAGEGIDD